MADNFKFSIPWENIGKNGLGALPIEKKRELEESVNRMNQALDYIRAYTKMNGSPVPKIYLDQAKDLVEYWCDSARMTETDRKNSEVSIAEELYVLDREKAYAYYEANVLGQAFDSITSPLERVSWDLRQYALTKVEHAVKYSRTFDQPTYIQLKKSRQIDTGMGWYIGYRINRFDLLENKGEFFDLQYETMREAAIQMGRAANEHLALGTTSVIGVRADDGEAGSSFSMTGFFNNASIQDFTCGTPTTYLDLTKAIIQGMTKLKTCYAPLVMFSSGGIHSQLSQNYPTYGHGNYSELEELMNKYVGPNKRIKKWWNTDKLIGAAASTSNQAICIMALDRRFMDRRIILPLQTLPTMEKRYSEDISEVMLSADIMRYKVIADSNVNAFPATHAETLTTTDVGFLTEEAIV
jgi:hypothetical protein